jgi:hypothetical protein
MPDRSGDTLTMEELQEWLDRARSRTEPYAVENPADVFFRDPAKRETYAAPLNSHVALIDLAAFPDGKPVEGLAYGRKTAIAPGGGNVFQLLLSEDGERLAITSIYALTALRTGAITPQDIGEDAGPTPSGLAVPAVIVARCAANAACREAVRNALGGAAFSMAQTGSSRRSGDSFSRTSLQGRVSHHPRAASINARMRPIATARPSKIASPMRKWPILSSTTSRIAATGPTLS